MAKNALDRGHPGARAAVCAATVSKPTEGKVSHRTQQVFLVGKVPIRRRGTDADHCSGFRDREIERAIAFDQFSGGNDQRIAQVAMMVGARAALMWRLRTEGAGVESRLCLAGRSLCWDSCCCEEVPFWMHQQGV